MLRLVAFIFVDAIWAEYAVGLGINALALCRSLNVYRNWWARSDLNRRPKDYEFAAETLNLGKSSVYNRN